MAQGVRLSLTIPQADYDRIVRGAKEENRSLSGEVLYWLRKAWAASDRGNDATTS
jgi:hypothetical protein